MSACAMSRRAAIEGSKECGSTPAGTSVAMRARGATARTRSAMIGVVATIRGCDPSSATSPLLGATDSDRAPGVSSAEAPPFARAGAHAPRSSEEAPIRRESAKALPERRARVRLTFLPTVVRRAQRGRGARRGRPGWRRARRSSRDRREGPSHRRSYPRRADDRSSPGRVRRGARRRCGRRRRSSSLSRCRRTSGCRRVSRSCRTRRRRGRG